MPHFTEITDDDGKVIGMQTNQTGTRMLGLRELNKGSAFTAEERDTFLLTGKLPDSVETLEEQVTRCYQQLQEKNTPLGKNLYLNGLRQSNITLFYRLVMEHIQEILPIIYTPTIGEAVEKFSYEFNRPSGLYFSYPNRHQFKDILKNRKNQDIDLIIITDGEGVLGIGDWGIGGMDICIGKLMVYTACGGINPRRVLPIQLDVGTNNEQLLNDPMYLGWRHKRITGKDYDDFIDLAVSAIRDTFPNIYLHWEDFGRDTARKNLNRYRDDMCTFNDDMQGTGATALACVLSALKATNQKLTDQRIVFFGAGTAGVGIADQICKAMLEAGLSEADAHKQFWLIDRPGLLTDDMDDLAFFQKPYARAKNEIGDWVLQKAGTIGLYDVVKNIQPTVLIGCSTVQGAFTEDVVKLMASYVEHPLIFPLSNPTSKCEAAPKDLLEWTEGKVLTAAGSPFDPVEFNGKTIRISQCNNAFVFPGLGLGIIASQATRCTDGMITAACHALADCSPALQDQSAPLLPDFDVVHDVAKKIALAVALEARKEGISDAPADLDVERKINAIFWTPEYVPYTLA